MESHRGRRRSPTQDNADENDGDDGHERTFKVEADDYNDDVDTDFADL